MNQVAIVVEVLIRQNGQLLCAVLCIKNFVKFIIEGVQLKDAQGLLVIICHHQVLLVALTESSNGGN